MDEIVQLMDCNDAASNKKIEENKRLIEECNDKLDEYQDKLLDKIIEQNKEIIELLKGGK